MVREAMDGQQVDWYELARQVRCKRFGEAPPCDHEARQKQWRYLSYRGFSPDQVREALA